jgi:opacity protein-like surface antigen
MNKKIILAAASLAIAASSAMAAEGKYYVKGNLGYGFAKQKLSDVETGKSSSKFGKGFIGGVGFGANLGSNVRTDLEFLMDDGLEAKRKSKIFDASLAQEVKSQLFLLNAHYDFKNSSKLTPFVTAGVGYGHNKYKVTLSGGDVSLSLKQKSNGLAYQAGFGAAYNMGKVDLELGYRFINKGAKNKTVPGTDLKFNKSSGQVHAIMAGVRVGF